MIRYDGTAKRKVERVWVREAVAERHGSRCLTLPALNTEKEAKIRGTEFCRSWRRAYLRAGRLPKLVIAYE